MEVRKAARMPLCRIAMRVLAVMTAALALSAAPALASTAKVLVFTGTAGTPNASSGDIASAIQAQGEEGKFTADVTSNAADINADKLAGYKAVVFVHSSGDVLNGEQEAALQEFVNSGGGFVGLGETALLEQGGNAYFNTLLGLSAQRVTGQPTTSKQDIEFLDRVHPSTRALPQVWENTETWYAWQTNPTGTVHTVARVRMAPGIPGPDGKIPTNDTLNPRIASLNAVQPQGNRAAAWCRDTQQGRSFYTELGSSSESVAQANIRKHLTGAIQWAAGLVRGNCKATINSNYTSTRITPINPNNNSNQYTSELTKSALADDGRLFYGGRAICFQAYQQITNWDSPNTGLGCGTVHLWDPRVPGSNSQNPAKISFVANLSVWGAHGSAQEYGQNSTSEAGLVGMTLDPKFTKGRPYVYIQYYPYWGGEQGKNEGPNLGPGFVGHNPPGRLTYKAEKRLSRFTYDDETKSFVPGSEKVIFSYTSPVYNCCHNGAGMAWDSKGNLYITNGDNVPNGTVSNGSNNQSNLNNGGYTNPHPRFTIPCPGMGATTHCGEVPEDERPADTGPLISYGDARATSGNTNVYEGKIVRIKPLDNPADTPGPGKTYEIPGDDAPNGPNLFPPDSQPVKDGKALPEIFSMGVRSTYTIHIDPETDAITTAWIGPDQTQQNPTWGPAKTENATMMNSAGNWGWPYCQGGNRWSYRVKLPNVTGGAAAELGEGDPDAVGGGEDGQTGAFFDCRGEIVNNSPYNTGLKVIPPAKPVNLWYGPQGGCYGYPRNANGVGIYPTGNNSPAPTIHRLCPWLGSSGSQAPIDGGIYRKPAGDKPDAWPSYWDGRWFLIDFAGANNLRHALLMDPETQFKGGQPTSVDSLLSIVPTSLLGGTRPVFMDFGADGALYIGSYAGSYYGINNNNNGVWRFAYTGGPDTPGPDPKAVVPSVGSEVEFNIGKSGGVSYTWDFGDGSPKVTTTDAVVSHTYDTAGTKTATLTVTYADGETESKSFEVADVPTPLFTNVDGTVSANVPLTLGLTLGQPASFGTFVPSVEQDYTASTTASVIASSGNAALSVSDADGVATGRLVNADYALPTPLQVKATSPAGVSRAFADVGGSTNPTTLLTYDRAVNDTDVTLDFKQHVGVRDALRAGRYSKTLTFTLSTTAP